MGRYNVLMLLAALVVPLAAAHATPTTFTTSLTQANEVPPTGSPATGSATIVLDPAANTLGVHVTFSGLTSNTTMAHIHCCLAFPLESQFNVGVATTVPAFPGFPLGVTSGTYDNVLDLTQASSYNPAFVTMQGGTIAGAEAALIKGIQNGETYLNIHTTKFPGGEIRGFLVAAPAPAQLSLLNTIPINGTAASPNTKMFSFDISWVDPTTGLYFLADRSNAALDVIDTTGAQTGTPDTLFGQIGGPAPNGAGFAGDTGNTATSGPNGVTVAPNIPCIFATDSASTGGGRVVSFNYSVSFTAPVSSLQTGGSGRADELAFDPKDQLLLVINNADTPPYGSLISVSSSCSLSLVKQFPFTSPVNATGGAEQPVWDPGTQKFYLSIPQIDGSSTTGGVLRINTSGVFENFYPINFCGPAGLTVGPNEDLLVGCNTVFTTSGNACTTVVAGTGTNGGTLQSLGAIVPPSCNGIANPQVAICNVTPGRDCTGNALVSVPGVGGGDEVWFNFGDGNYYVTGGNEPGGPVFGVVASGADTLSQVVGTLYAQLQQGVAGTPSFVHSAGTVHSIAASAANNHVYVALPANTAYPNCSQGCIAVFGVP